MLGREVAWLLAPLVIVGVLVLGRRRSWPTSRRVASLALGLYIVFLVSELLFPMPVDARDLAQRATLGGVIRSAQWVPLHTLSRQLAAWTRFTRDQLFGNVAVFVPLGFLAPLAIPWLRPAKRAVPGAVLAGLGAEALQASAILVVGAAYRFIDVDDALLNAVGALIGFAASRMISGSLDGHADDR